MPRAAGAEILVRAECKWISLVQQGIAVRDGKPRTRARLCSMANMTILQLGTGGQKFGLESKLVILEEQLKGSSKKLLESDENVARWYANLARSSQLTVNSRIRRLGWFCKNAGITPAEMVATGRGSNIKAEDMIT